MKLFVASRILRPSENGGIVFFAGVGGVGTAEQAGTGWEGKKVASNS